MTDDAPLFGNEPSERAEALRPWVGPRVQRLIATSAETGIAGSTDSSETLS